VFALGELSGSIATERSWLSQDNYGGIHAVNIWKEQQMKSLKISLLVVLALAITSWVNVTTPIAHASVAQNQSTALERGWRTGYSDGYTAGTRDVTDQLPSDYKNKEDYQRADRSYNEAWGTVEDYRDGYQQGFEAGYTAGFERRSFDSSIPTGLKTRGTTDSATNNSPPNPIDNNSTPPDQTANNPAPVGAAINIPRNAMLLVELESSLSSDASQRGDRFQARVIEPQEFAGAIVEGRVTRVKRAGKVKGSSELQLSFESIRMADGRSASLSADVVELVNNMNRDDSATVDSEGGVKGRSSTKDDIAKVGASTGIGAIIGAVIGGGKGAAIGAAIGGSVGAGSVFSKRGQDVRLDRGQQLRIRTATEARL
jgi:hypothetical protein